MTDSDPADVRGTGMDEAAVEEALTEFGHGTLALTWGSEAYGVPVSFGYDGERVFCYLIQFGDRSRKLEFAAETDRATLTAYRAASPTEWQSVIASGPLVALPESDVEHMERVMDDNAWFPTIFPSAEPMQGLERFALEVEEVTGRVGGRP